jgi:fermentation-respiration switch protein FrsA (DUF1100 family)
MESNVQRVTFKSDGATLTGDLYLPRERSRPLPGLVVTGSWLTVKGQMPAVYAARMAGEGYAALAFDFRGWGESEGEPRFHESPVLKARDIRNAVAFLRTQPEIAADRIGALAVCASSGYAAMAATEEPTLRSLVMVAPWLHNQELVRLVYGGEQGVRERLEKAHSAKDKYDRTGKVDVVVATSATDSSAAMFGDFAYYLDAKRGAIKSWDNKMAVMSWIDWLEFDAIRLAPRLKTPTLLVHSERAAVPDGARAFHAALRGPKQIRWTDGDQFAFYDQEPQVSFSVNAAAEHFRGTLL